MKRLLSILLVCCMAVSVFSTTAAAASNELDAPGFFDGIEEEAPRADLSEPALGNELVLNMYRSWNTETVYEVEVRAEDGSVVTGSLDAFAGARSLDDETSQASLTLTGIPDGVNTVTVTAPYHISYVQEVEFDHSNVILNLSNNHALNEDNGKFGIIPAGDINNDGRIDDTDAETVLDSSIDLTGDGKVDLKDLAVVVRNEDVIVPAPVVTYTTPEIELGENTIVEQAPTEKSFTIYREDSAVITEENPVVVDLVPPTNSDTGVAGIVIGAPAEAGNTITEGVIEVTGEDGTIYTYPIPGSVSARQSTRASVSRTVGLHAVNSLDTGVREAAPEEITREEDGTIVIDFGNRVVIKKVTIRATGTESGGALAEIAKVEFFQNFEDRIPEPKLDIPEVVSVSNTEADGQGYRALTISWTPQQNVTGYEVSVSGEGYNKTAVTANTRHTFQGDSFNGTVKAFKTYAVRVRSVNGDWKSGWSEVWNHEVTCTKVPPAPEYVNVVAGVKQLKVSWRCKFDAETFSVFYKKTSESSFTEVPNITGQSYTLTGLEGGVEYTVYVVAHNRNGSSGKSKNAVGLPMTPEGVDFPQYKLFGQDVIKSVSGNANKSYTIYRADGSTVSNGSATAEDWKVLLDDDPNTYVLIPDWDSGVDYENFRGPIVELNERRTLDTIRISPSQTASVHMNTVRIRYRDENGEMKTIGTKFFNRTDKQNRRYYEAVFESPITTDYLEVRTSTRYGASQNYTLCELKLYDYDDLEAKVEALFADVSHSRLNEDVTEESIQALIDRVNTLDPESGEYHPHRETILNDLNYAMQILKDGQASDPILVDNQITAAKGPASGFAQALSDYQPLGYTAKAGSTVILYVEDLKGAAAQGSNVNLQLVATQVHPEVAAWQSSAVQLKAGRNEVTVPRIGSYAKEAGGSLYLRYTGEKGAKEYAVRVIGGTRIPVLNLDGVTGSERTARIEAYVEELGAYAGSVSALHESTHSDIGYAYQANECFLNVTEITMENMMFSVPATQVWAAISANPTAKLANSIAAMEQEIDYFYQFKGLNKAATDADAYPNTRLNIRYHQMFTGAFMYAGGKHIGIEWGSVGGLFQTNPITTDANGKKTGGNYSGWGVAHEIGHCINAASYQRVEVTNNIFAQLAQTDETNATARPQPNNIYKAVVTGTTGHTGNLATQLGMYWQLHLAYDNDYSFKVYDSIEAQQAGLFYARAESYLRTPGKAKYPLTTTSGDQGFMQAVCAAAERDVLDFFRAWGIIPNQATEAYAAQYAKETRKIQYLDDNSRLYRLENKPGMSNGTTVTAAITTPILNSQINSSRVTISLSNSNTNENAMLGYEISRNGKTVAFVPAGEASYTDVVTTENNRSFVYTVTGIDRLLNETETVVLDEVKISHDGAIDKTGWSVTTNMTSADDEVLEYDPENSMGHEAESVSAIARAIDNDVSTVYYGTKPADSGSAVRPQIILDLGGVKQVTALKFTPDQGEHSNYRLFGYKVEISTDNATWTTVKEGDCYTGSASRPESWVKQEDIIYNADGSYTLYFNKKAEDGSMDPYMYTYDAAFVRLTATNMSSLGVAELDILGPTNDNVDLKPEGYGRLKEDFVTDGQVALTKGSIIFYGDYKGDPSYSVVLLKDQNGRIINGEQLILASVTETGYLGETSDGRWVYSVQEADLTGVTDVIAELYRVQDALTMVGQRLTSTSLHMTLPDTCPDVILDSNTEHVAARVADAGRAVVLDDIAAEITAGEAQTTALAYGDTGSTEGEIIGRVKLTAGEGTVDFEAMRQGTSIAMQVEFTGIPKNMLIEGFAGDEKVFRTSRYDSETGVLRLYGVKRSGTYNGGLFAGRIAGLAEGTTVTAVASDLFATSSPLQVDNDIKCEITLTAGSKPGTGEETPGTDEELPGEEGKLPAFTDVPANAWYLEDLKWAYANGVMYGTSETRFSPNAAMTRGMLVATLYRMEKSPEVPSYNPFADVNSKEYYANAVKWAYGNKIVAGYSSTKFAPEKPVTREETVAILYRYAQYKKRDTSASADLSGYKDVNRVQAYALPAMKWACAAEIVHGTTATTLSPQGKATRAEVVALLHRF